MSEKSIPVDDARLFLDGLPRFERHPDKEATLHLEEAEEKGENWFVTLLLKADMSLLKASTAAWTKACVNGHLFTLLAFIDKCDNQEFISVCQKDRQTPLHHIKLPKYEQYKELLSNAVMQELKNELDKDGATPLHRALQRKELGLSKALFETDGVKLDIEDKNQKTALNLLEEGCVDDNNDDAFFELYKDLLQSPLMKQDFKNMADKEGATPLHRAIKQNFQRLAKTLMETKGVNLEMKDNNSKTPLDLIEERCRLKSAENRFWYDLYKKVLVRSDMLHKLKNHKGSKEASTPLHIAIEWEDEDLAKTLLETKRVELDIKDRNGYTALDLLEQGYNSGTWNEMCLELRLDPSIKIFKFKYFQRRTSLMRMQETLSVVAALLATITFAAEIAVPGGADQTYGTAILAREAGFLVFTVANTLAMCSSIVVLFTMIGAVIWEAHPNATSLIDTCVFLLQVSLGGTIVAFMTGVYAIMAPKVKWAAFVVIGLSSIAFIVALVVVSFFWPLLYKPFSYFKHAVCRLVSHAKCCVCCGHLATDNGSPDAPSQQSGNLNVPDSSTVIALASNEAESSANANTVLINGASDGPTPAALPSIEPPLSANAIMPVSQVSDGPRTAVLEHSQQQLQKTNKKADESVQKHGLYHVTDMMSVITNLFGLLWSNLYW